MWAGWECKRAGTWEEVRRRGTRAFLLPVCSWPAAVSDSHHSRLRDVTQIRASGLLVPKARSLPLGLGAPSLSCIVAAQEPPGSEPSRTKSHIEAGNPGVFSHLTRISINSVPAPTNPSTEGKSRLINDQLFQSRPAIIALVAFMITR